MCPIGGIFRRSVLSQDRKFYSVKISLGKGKGRIVKIDRL